MTIDNLKDTIVALCQEKDMTIKELAHRAGLNENGLHNKFRRQSITVKDFMTLLSALDKDLQIIDKCSSKE